METLETICYALGALASGSFAAYLYFHFLRTKEVEIPIVVSDIPEQFILRDDKSLERVAIDTPIPKDHLSVLNPLVTSQYVEEGNVLRPINEVPEGKEPYKFKENFAVYMKSQGEKNVRK